MDLSLFGSIASVIGLPAGFIIAYFQHRKAASLGAHLTRQQWQQLRSLGDQIDSIEKEGTFKTKPLARLGNICAGSSL